MQLLVDVAVQLLKHSLPKQTKVIQKLIDENFINLTSDSTFLAAFDFAFRRGSVELGEKLLGLLNDSNSQIEQLYSKAMYYNAENNWRNILSKLLDKRVDVNAVTALCTACRERHESIVRLLLDNGADPNVPGDFGRTVLHCAVNPYQYCNSYVIMDIWKWDRPVFVGSAASINTEQNKPNKKQWSTHC